MGTDGAAVNVLVLLVAALMGLVVPGLKQTSKPFQWASDTQAAAWEYGPSPMCMSGGWGSGKTYVGCAKAVYLSTRYKNNRGVIVRQVGKELRATTMATFYKVCPRSLYAQDRGGRRSDIQGYMKFASEYGSDILFLNLEDPDSAGIIRGLEINWFLWDQAEENPEHGEELFDLLLGRLGRWDLAEVPADEIADHEREHGEPWPYVHPETGKAVPPPYPMLAVNPDVETHWIYRRFHPESAEHFQPLENQPSYHEQGYRMFHMPSEDNRFLGETNRRFLLAHDAAFIRRNVKGLWGQPEGAIHVVDALSLVPGSRALVEFLKRTCTLFRTLDYGDSAPTCCTWWAVDRNGNCFAWQEYYLPNVLISQARSDIASLSGRERFELDLADPSIFHTMPAKKGGRFCVADEYADTVEQPRETAIFWQPADNNELGTRNRINEYLRVDPERIHPITKQRGSPRLFCLTRTDDWPQGIVHGLQQIRAQRRVKIGTDLGKAIFSDERDPSIPDHAYDNWRYFIASRPPAPPMEGLIRTGTFAGARRLSVRARQLARVR